MTLDADAVAPALARAVGTSPRGLGRVAVVGRTGSTSTDLADHARAGWPDRSVLVADHQAAGRGRAGRSWETPPGVALTASVLLRPEVPVHALGWLPLLGGLAVVRALAGVGVEAVLKWPNDVLVPDAGASPVPGWGRDRKVAGVLGELVPGGPPDEPPAAVVGIGVNVAQEVDDLPVPHATSLAALGVAVERVDLLARVVYGARALASSTLSRSEPPDAGSGLVTESMYDRARTSEVTVPALTLPAEPPPTWYERTTRLFRPSGGTLPRRPSPKLIWPVR